MKKLTMIMIAGLCAVLALPAAFAQTQNPPIVPQAEYNAAFPPNSFPTNYHLNIFDNSSRDLSLRRCSLHRRDSDNSATRI